MVVTEGECAGLWSVSVPRQGVQGGRGEEMWRGRKVKGEEVASRGGKG